MSSPGLVCERHGSYWARHSRYTRMAVGQRTQSSLNHTLGATLRLLNEEQREAMVTGRVKMRYKKAVHTHPRRREQPTS